MAAVGRFRAGRRAGVTGGQDLWIRRTHDRVRDDAGPDRWDRLLSSHARPGRVAWPARLGGSAYATVGRRDDRRGVDDAACRIAVRQRGGLLPWVLLVIGTVASLAANVAVAEPTLTGRVIAAWPSFALIGSYELLMRQVRRTASDTR